MRNGWIRRQRLMGFLAATAFVMMLAGDRGAHTAPPPGAGVDPLAILDLQVRPNAIVVFDTSGSMNEGLDNTTLSDDHPRSKMYQ
ncbi:MAG: hypothetical protein JXO72_11415, partial [Vicinamibacteria bacterium]|nr:hypothetical protein [Vicinamibacteria bacterium]